MASDRRSFVRRAGGVLVAAAVVPSCSEAAGTAPTGIVRVKLDGLAPGATSAGTAVVSGAGLNFPIIVAIPTASGEAAVPIGTYHVLYQPPAGYSIAPGTPNEADLTISENDVTEITFTVLQASATIHLVVNGLGLGVPSGGSAQVLRTDIANQVPVGAAVPSNGVLNMSVLPGSYSVDYTAPATHQLVAGQVDPRSVTLLTSETANVVYELETVPPPQGVVFHSDWSTALGITDAAVRDTGKTIPWDIVIGSSNPLPGRLVVVPSVGLDFPSANCLQVDGIDIDTIQTRQVSILPASNRWPVPAVGESVWFRVYKRLVYPCPLQPDLGNNNHALEERSGNASNWSFSFDVNVNGWRPKLQSQVANRYYLSNGGSGNAVYLLRNVTYRFEWQVHRIGASTCNLHIRILNSAGTLLYDDDDFYINASNHLGQNPALALSDANALDAWQLGTNGPGANPNGDIIPMWYFGCAAVSRSNWCGPYSNGV